MRNLNFYSHIPCGMWQNCEGYADVTADFYSHIPCGMWLTGDRIKAERKGHFYSHIPCGMWPIPGQQVTTGNRKFLLTHPVWDVTHAKRGKVSIVSFLLTHPVWDVTHTSQPVPAGNLFLLTHPVWDVTHLWNHPGEISYLFLLTHPVWDVTLGSSSKDGGANAFLLTHPVWDVTVLLLRLLALRKNFYSHIPCGMWRDDDSSSTDSSKFLLTHPVWDVTKSKIDILFPPNISTHTSRVGCDFIHVLL